MRTKIAVALGIVYVVWGSTYLAIAVADRTLPPLLMLAARFALAGGLLYAWSAWRGDVRAARPGRHEWKAAAIVGGLLLFVETGGVAWAEQRVASGLTALLIAAVPLFTALLDRTFFGIRLSLGSTRAQIAGLVLRDNLWLIGAGLAIGLPLAVAATRSADALLFGLAATDVPTVVGATSVLAAAGLLAAVVPAWRAAQTRPDVALRSD